MRLDTTGRSWKRVVKLSLLAGLATGSLGTAFSLYMVIAAEANVEDICTMTEVGQGLLPYGDEGGCDPRWLIWALEFVVFGGMGAIPVALIGSVLALASRAWRAVR